MQEVLHRDDGTVIGVGTRNDFTFVSYFHQGSLARGEKLWVFFSGTTYLGWGGHAEVESESEYEYERVVSP
jgi:hypothetical protein